MYTQFFGNYLLSKGYINKEQLFTAMKRQNNEHTRLGTLAMHAGYMTADEVDNTIIQQTHRDLKFGELAIDLGYLTKGQVIELLKSQSPDFLLLGQILVDQGAISYSELEQIIHDYKDQNGISDSDLSLDNTATLSRLISNYFITSETNISKYGNMYVELLFNNLVRFIGEDFTPTSTHRISEYTASCIVSQKVLGAYSIISYLDMSEEAAIAFASRYVGDTYDSYNEYVQAALDDFLNLHNGLFIVNVSNEDSIELSITAPMHHDGSCIQFEGETYIVPLLFSFGTVNYIIEIKEPTE